MRQPTCLPGWRLLLLILGGVVRVVSVVSIHFSCISGRELHPSTATGGHLLPLRIFPVSGSFVGVV